VPHALGQVDTFSSGPALDVQSLESTIAWSRAYFLDRKRGGLVRDALDTAGVLLPRLMGARTHHELTSGLA
jgi:hypothetical protein